jgi:hypothetical protein
MFSTVSHATLCSVKFIKSYSVQKFVTTCFDQCGHHQMLKLLGEETAIFCFVACVVNIILSPLDAYVCLSWWVVFSLDWTVRVRFSRKV